ncbi:ATP-binding cassette domain-containing protein, partial [Microvirga sp. 3-52]|nr:ATP-binding cassette domain-containing protein [Microvirga sp. 3-52]
MAMLIGKLNGVSVRYGEKVIIDEVTAEIPAGARIAIVGPNGAGKTTLLSVLAGETALTS